MYKALCSVGSMVLGGSAMAMVAFLQLFPPTPHPAGSLLRKEPLAAESMAAARQPTTVRARQLQVVERSPYRPIRAQVPASVTRPASTGAGEQASGGAEPEELVVCSDFRELGPTLVAGTPSGETRSVRLLCPKGASAHSTFGGD